MTGYAACLILALVLWANTAIAEDFTWPGTATTAVSLSYDDTLNSQLDNARPALNRYGLKGSFYLLLSTPVLTERLSEWRALAAEGHELGNHTVYHACSKSQPGMDWVPDHNNLDNRVVAQMRDELLVANAFLYSIDGKTERTLTPPCLHIEVSDGNYIEAVRDLFVAIKGQENNLPQDFATFILPDGESGEELIQFVESAAEKYPMIHIIMHGIGGDHMAVSTEAHEQLLAHLAANRDRFWTDTYLNIMRHLNQYYGD